MNTMRAIQVENPGADSTLKVIECDIPTPKAGEVLIKVTAAGINRPDLIQRAGNYNPPPGITDILGLEISGEIADVNGCEGFQKSDKVMALLAGGGYAEYAVAPIEQVLPLPHDDMPLTHAAGVPETFFTVWTNLFDSGHLKRGERVLIHGGTSGIGTTAIQIAKAWECDVFVTAGNDEKCAHCIKQGADHAINYKTQDFVTVVKDATKGKGVNLILDMVGGDYVPRNLACLAPFGRHVSIARLNGTVPEFDVFPLMKKRLTMTGSTLRMRPSLEKGAIATALVKNIWPLMAEGKIAPVIDRIFKFEDADKAHKHMQSSAHIGKIILEL